MLESCHLSRPASVIALILAFSSVLSGAEPTARVDPQLGPSVAFHVNRAAARLKKPECAQVLQEFRNEAGLPLSARLDELKLSPSEFVAQLTFTRAPARSTCDRPGILAYTKPGSLEIWVCRSRFLEIANRDEALVTSTLIHETLHSLGLGENPPTPAEITARVMARCGR